MAGLPGRLRAGDDGLQPIQQVVAARLLAQHADRAGRGRVGDGQRISRRHLRQSAPLGIGRKRGEQNQAIGRSRGGRNTKIHAIADAKGRLISLVLTDGASHDCPAAQPLISKGKAAKRLLGDKAYDSADMRRWLRGRGTKCVIPNRSNRKRPFAFNKKAYRERHRVENAFCRLKDFRRIATRYDRLARNFLASVCLAATIIWWA